MLHSVLGALTFIMLKALHFLSHVYYKIRHLIFEPLTMKYIICLFSVLQRSESDMWHRKHGKKDSGIIFFFFFLVNFRSMRFTKISVDIYVKCFLIHLLTWENLFHYIFNYIFRKQDLSSPIFLYSIQWCVQHTMNKSDTVHFANKAILPRH